MATYTVTTTSDVVDAGDGVLSLREAVQMANAGAGPDSIVFAPGLEGGEITLTGGELALTNDVTINGDVNGDHKADVTVSGNNASRIFSMTGSGTDVHLASLALINGDAGLGAGGAINASNINTLEITDTTIANNSARSGGGIYAGSTDVSISNSLVNHNHADISGGGFDSFFGSLTVTNTTVNDNSSNVNGGGINEMYTAVTLNDSTVTNNKADADGSYASSGGGIYQFFGSTTIKNTVVAENTSGGSANDVYGYVGSANNSFFGTTVSINSGANNINNGGNPVLGELLDNGGTVLTRSPLDGSPLIDAGSNALLPADTTDVDHDGNTAETLPLDARGGLRIVGGTVDIGAVEQILNESINGTDGDNNIIGGLGTDTLSGLGGNDTVDGGADNDVLYGGNGNDTLLGGADNDTLLGGAGGDLLNGGTGADRAQYIDATAGVTADLQSPASNTGDASGDTYVSIEDLYGSNFDDILRGNTGSNHIWGAVGNDLIFGRNGHDSLYGMDGNDTLVGGGGSDLLNGGSGIDRAQYNDATAGVTADLQVSANNTGFAGGDSYVSIEDLYGSNFGDTLRGDAGSNAILGADGNDVILGRDGQDTLYGGTGNDTLIGQAGRDFLYGNGGNDAFVYQDIADSAANYLRDQIRDFSTGADVINLLNIDANTILGGNQAFTFIGAAGFHGVAGELRSAVASGNSIVSGDVNGDGNADFSILVAGITNLHASDFFL